jgi:hypothetical protein
MTKLAMRGRAARAPVYTLVLRADGSAVLLDSPGNEVWTSDDEDATEFREAFGEFIEDERLDALTDWLFEHLDSLPANAEIESRIEYDEDDEDEDEDEDEDG